MHVESHAEPKSIRPANDRKTKGESNPNLRVAGGGDEEQAAVNTGILDEAITHGGQLLAKEGRVLVLDVLDNRLPATSKKDGFACG